MAKIKESKKQSEQDNLIEKSPANPPVNAKKSVFKTIYWVAVLLVIYFIWQNPSVLDKYINYAKSLQLSDNNTTTTEETASENNSLNELSEQFVRLQNEVYAIRQVQNNTVPAAPVDLSSFENRLDAIEKHNVNVIDSKADVATVLGLVTRLDKLEDQLEKVAKVTDQGALVLSATMMIKEAGDNGQIFEYETEILQQLADGDLKLKEPIAVFVKYAKEGIHTKNYIINEFESIYKALLKEQKKELGQTWKDRINNKFNEIIKVKRVNKDAQEFEAEKELDLVYRLVKGGDLYKALKEIDKNENPELLENASLKKWIANARARVEFDNAVTKISSYSLALMKVNYIKKETIND